MIINERKARVKQKAEKGRGRQHGDYTAYLHGKLIIEMNYKIYET